MVEGVGDECTGESTADVVSNVPQRHFPASLGGGEPVHHDAAGGRPAHTLEDAVDGHEDGEDTYRNGAVGRNTNEDIG